MNHNQLDTVLRELEKDMHDQSDVFSDRLSLILSEAKLSYKEDEETSVNAPERKDLNKEHAELHAALSKPGMDILETLTPTKVDLLHMMVGVQGEAGELLDAVKKHVVYNKALDVENVIEELGDIEFYLQGVRANLGITREETLEHNLVKLRKRYAAGYSDKAAQERADKA
jgi:NTP pyrophosphatase (non-canonical NTP hydrolase)